MIEVNYNEYKETIAQNMKLVVENHDLKEKIERLNNIIDKAREYIEERYNRLREENKRLNNIIKETIDFVESMEYCGQEDYFYDLKAKDECGNDNTFDDSKHKLLEILKGSDKEC